MKQTAVEWFFNELYSIRKTIPFEQQADAILKAFEQAKAMEKEQIVKASAIAYEDMFGSDGTEYGEEYYNKTFKSE